jgi:hypothetical protein
MLRRGGFAVKTGVAHKPPPGDARQALERAQAALPSGEALHASRRGQLRAA